MNPWCIYNQTRRMRLNMVHSAGLDYTLISLRVLYNLIEIRIWYFNILLVESFLN